MKTSILRQKTFAFAVKIVRLVQRLQSEKKEFVMSHQLLKCGTSVGANDSEAEFAQSKDDFISKLKMCIRDRPSSYPLPGEAYLQHRDYSLP